MATAVKAVWEDGVFKPKEPVALEEKTEVEVLIPSRCRPDDDDPTGWKSLNDMVGCIKDAPPDMAENHDKYLYGDPDR